MLGGSLKALKEILGQNDIKMTMRYAHLSKEFAKEEIQLINGLTSSKKSVEKKIVSQNCHKFKILLDTYLLKSLSVLVELRGIEPLTS